MKPAFIKVKEEVYLTNTFLYHSNDKDYRTTWLVSRRVALKFKAALTQAVTQL